MSILIIVVLVIVMIATTYNIWHKEDYNTEKYNMERRRGFDWAAGSILRRDATISAVKEMAGDSTDPFNIGVREACFTLGNMEKGVK